MGSLVRSRDIGGTYNLNLWVETTGGAYVVRVHRPWVSPERLASIQGVKRRLRARGFPLPESLTTLLGEGFVHAGDRLVEVERFVPHDGVADSWERYGIGFSVLGRLHDFLHRNVTEEILVPPRVSNYQPPLTLIDWVQRTEAALRQAPPDEQTGRALEICAGTKALLAPIIAWWRQTGSHLPRQPIHGDFGGENLLFSQDRLVAILDFDFLAVRERLYDLAYCLYWMLARLAPDRLVDSETWGTIGELIASYNRATSRPLSVEEARSLPIEMARVPLYWIGEAGFLPDPAGAVLAMAGHVERSRLILENADRIAALLD